jgi:DnaJ like chaperone protein
MAVLLVVCLIVAGIKALFRLVTGAARREKEEEQRRWDERRKEEEECKRQEQARRKIIEDAKQQFEQTVMGGRFPSEQVLAVLADCDSDIPTNLKEALEEMLYGSCTLHSMAFGDAVGLIQQRQRVEERAKKRAARGEGRRPEPTGAVTEGEAYELLGVSQGCTPEELARAYHRKVSEWHPDKLDTMAQELRDYATRRTARINEAYDRLRSARV